MEESKSGNAVYRRLQTREVNVGGLLMGNGHPIRLQTMTTTDTMDTEATVMETIRCIEAGAELVRITAPSKKEAENLEHIKKELARRGYHTPLVADIHFTPNAAEIAARLVEKVRVNPGNYIDKKKFETIEYTDAEYAAEIDRIRKRFTPLVSICKAYGTAMRIGTNHGSLSDRIMSRYGDTPMGMVESAMEFLRIARYEHYHNIVLSMKSSNPQVMVQAYRLLVQCMYEEFGECYPLHLGVTEAGDGEEGRIKSAVGIGALLEDGIGDTVRVSLTEAPEREIPVCRDLVKRYAGRQILTDGKDLGHRLLEKYRTQYRRRFTFPVDNIGGQQVPVVIADLSKVADITPAILQNIGYTYRESLDKWEMGDLAADYLFTGKAALPFPLPGMLKVITTPGHWQAAPDKNKYYPLFDSPSAYLSAPIKSDTLNFVMLDAEVPQEDVKRFLAELAADKTVVYWTSSHAKNALEHVRALMWLMEKEKVAHPVVLAPSSPWHTAGEHLIHYATECGALLLEGFGDGICLGMHDDIYHALQAGFADGKPSEEINCLHENTEAFLNATAFSILQATRTRISKTEYISCPSCGRTLFDLQETTARIRAVTHHLKGVKIAIMGCIVNGPGEMADADFGYVGSGVGKITLYKGKEVVKRAVDSAVAVDELIGLLKESGAWVEPVAATV